MYGNIRDHIKALPAQPAPTKSTDFVFPGHPAIGGPAVDELAKLAVRNAAEALDMVAMKTPWLDSILWVTSMEPDSPVLVVAWSETPQVRAGSFALGSTTIVRPAIDFFNLIETAIANHWKSSNPSS